MAISLASGDTLPYPDVLLAHPGWPFTPLRLRPSHHPNVLTHRKRPTPVDPVALSPTPARYMEHEQDPWRWRGGVAGE